MIAAAGGPPDGRRPSLFDTPEDRRLAALAWTAALAASFLLLALFQFRSGDPDSNVYAGISARLAAEPFVRWIAPEWWGQWDFTGPFREHPIGIFVLPALSRGGSVTRHRRRRTPYMACSRLCPLSWCN